MDFRTRTASPPASLGVYCNIPTPSYCTTPVPKDAVLVASPFALSVLLAIPDGAVALWDGTVGRWAVARKDFTALGGAYGALGENLFVVDHHLLDASLYPAVDLESQSGASSGVAFAGTFGLRATADSRGAGTLERIDLVALDTYHATSSFEAP